MKSCIDLSPRVMAAAAFLAGFVLTFTAHDALAINRQWTGNSGTPFAWSTANNWSPTGAPQSGDDLVFQNMMPSSNDISGVVVSSMKFSPGASGMIILRGLPVTVAKAESAVWEVAVAASICNA